MDISRRLTLAEESVVELLLCISQLTAVNFSDFAPFRFSFLIVGTSFNALAARLN